MFHQARGYQAKRVQRGVPTSSCGSLAEKASADREVRRIAEDEHALGVPWEVCELLHTDAIAPLTCDGSVAGR